MKRKRTPKPNIQLIARRPISEVRVDSESRNSLSFGGLGWGMGAFGVMASMMSAIRARKEKGRNLP